MGDATAFAGFALPLALWLIARPTSGTRLTNVPLRWTSLRRMGTRESASTSTVSQHLSAASITWLRSPRRASLGLLEDFDGEHMAHNFRSNQVPLTNEACAQVRLSIRSGGQGFTPTGPINFSAYAASLLPTERLHLLRFPDGYPSRVGLLAFADQNMCEFVHRLLPLFRTEYGTRFPPIMAAELIKSPHSLWKDLCRSCCESAALFVSKGDLESADPKPAGNHASENCDRIRRFAVVHAEPLRL